MVAAWSRQTCNWHIDFARHHDISAPLIARAPARSALMPTAADIAYLSRRLDMRGVHEAELAGPQMQLHRAGENAVRQLQLEQQRNLDE